MANSADEEKEVIRFAGRLVIIIIFTIGTGIFLTFDKTGNTFVDTWCWLTLAAVSEWILEKPLTSVVTGAKNFLSRITLKGTKNG